MAESKKASVDQEIAGHEYDGIKEYDNPLPRWWLWLFILSIFWSVVYVVYFHLGPGLDPEGEYQAEMAAAAAAHPQGGEVAAADLEAKVADPAVVAAGKDVFGKNCVACHGPDGGGLVGPNLADDFFIHGGTPADLFRTISEGVPEKGMLAWKKMLKGDELVAVTAYVKSLRGTTPANPKAPEGQKL